MEILIPSKTVFIMKRGPCHHCKHAINNMLELGSSPLWYIYSDRDLVNKSVHVHAFSVVKPVQRMISITPITWWRHQMETFSALLALCVRNSLVPVNSPHKGQWRGALMFSLICAWINGWVNNREAGDLRLHHGHYDVNVMISWKVTKL